MGALVCKFGGSSLADAGQFHKVRQILQMDSRRTYVVPSAPGRRFEGDEKVTDLLYRAHALCVEGRSFGETFEAIRQRYIQIKDDLGLSIDIASHLEQVRAGIESTHCADYAASRGEYLAGLLLADYLGYDFIDAAEVICFTERGAFDAERTNQVLSARLAKHPCAVIPGFYGSLPGGTIKTFSRGGSDISGAIVARAAAAQEYENWTDESGFLMADPRVVDHPHTIEVLTYRELRELSYMGAIVLHEEAIFPVREAKIPVRILNTNRPTDAGTIIVDSAVEGAGPVTGIAGRRGYSAIVIEKAMMNSELGFGRKVLKILEDEGISFEHMPSGIDTMSVLVQDSLLRGHEEAVVAGIRRECAPDSVDIIGGLSLLATVGRGMVSSRGIAARLFGSLARAGINIRMIDQGSSELNIIVGLDTRDFETAMRAVYQEFTTPD